MDPARRHDPHLGKGVHIETIMEHLRRDHADKAVGVRDALSDDMPTAKGARDLALSVHWWCHTGDASLDKPGWRMTD